MKIHTKKELLEKAAHHFEQGAKVMYGTEDGNLFHEKDKHVAHNHSKLAKVKLHVLSLEDIEAKVDAELDSENTETKTGKKGK